MTAGDTNGRLTLTSLDDTPSAHSPFGLQGAIRLPPMDASAYRDVLREGDVRNDARLSVYVHLPFCPSRCLTCDHHSTVTHDGREIDRYLDYVDREMSLVMEQLGRRPALQQLHLSGGTPNYLSDTQLVRLIDIIDRHFVVDSDTEASLEANAHRASRSQLNLLHGLGFRTLNLEVQELHSDVLKAVGRAQSLEVVADVIDSARAVGFETVGTELRYGLPRQNSDTMKRTLQQLLSVQPDRISCFSHSRLQNSFEHQRAVEAGEFPSLGDKLAMFSRIVDTLCGSGYEWIGLDYFAREEDSLTQAQRRGELQRNVIGYTARGGRKVLGFGINSLSDLSSIRVHNHPTLERWRSALERGELPICAGETIAPPLRERRDALSDLVCNLQSNTARQLFDGDCDPAMQTLVDDGLVEIGDEHVSLTDSGRFALHRLYGNAVTDPQWWDLVA